MTKKVLLIDNYDSFVYNLGDEFARLGCQVEAYRANLGLDAALEIIQTLQPDLLVLSPGPGSPNEATLCMDLLANVPEDLPVFGVCLGHQCMVAFFGGEVVPCGKVVHGKASKLSHNNQGVFANLPNPLQIGRYHSLVGQKIPGCLLVDAHYNGIVMSVRHKTRPLYGVQFHPESVLTPEGLRVIENVLKLNES